MKKIKTYIIIIIIQNTISEPELSSFQGELTKKKTNNNEKATGQILFDIFEYVLHSFVQVKRWPMLLIKKRPWVFSRKCPLNIKL